MAKKAGAPVSDRKDPKKNKSLAIRITLGKLPNAKAAEIVEAVKKEYGHDVTPNVIYMTKTKMNVKKTRKKRGESATKDLGLMTSAKSWVNAIQAARDLVKSTGGADNAIALIKAVGG